MFIPGNPRQSKLMICHQLADYRSLHRGQRLSSVNTPTERRVTSAELLLTLKIIRYMRGRAVWSNCAPASTAIAGAGFR